jgi:hypothetical protein
MQERGPVGIWLQEAALGWSQYLGDISRHKAARGDMRRGPEPMPEDIPTKTQIEGKAGCEAKKDSP